MKGFKLFIFAARLLKRHQVPTLYLGNYRMHKKMLESNPNILVLFKAGKWQMYYLQQVIQGYLDLFQRLDTRDPVVLAQHIPATEHPVYSLFLQIHPKHWMLLCELVTIVLPEQLMLPIPENPERSYALLPNKKVLLSLSTRDPTTVLVPVVNMTSKDKRFGKPGCVIASDSYDPEAIEADIDGVKISLAIQLHNTRRGGHNAIISPSMISHMKFQDAITTGLDYDSYPYRVKMQCPKGLAGCGMKECTHQLYVDEILQKLSHHISYLKLVREHHVINDEIVALCNHHIKNTTDVIRDLQNKFYELVMKMEDKIRMNNKIALVVKCPNPRCDINGIPVITTMPGSDQIRLLERVSVLCSQDGKKGVQRLCQTVTCQACVTMIDNEDGTQRSVPTTFCSLCSGIHSDGEKCPKAKRYTPEEEKAYIKNAQESLNLSLCPWCKEEEDESVFLERSGGCPKIKCIECHRSFCCECNGKIEPGMDYVDRYFANDRSGEYVCRTMFLLFAILNKEVKETFNGREIVTKGDMRWIIGTIIYSASSARRYDSTASEMRESIRNGSIIDDDGTITIGVFAIARLCEVFGIRERTYGRGARGFRFLLNENQDIAKKVVDLVDDYTANERSPNHIPDILEYNKFKEELTAKLEVEEEEDGTLFGKLFDE